jgi:ABC-type sugar transport system, periplasmic component
MKKTTGIILSILLILALSISSFGFSTVAVKSIKLKDTSVSLDIGKTYAIKATITPANATNKKLTYKSDNPGIASVDANGNVKAIKAGKTAITVASVSNKKATAKLSVTVKAAAKITLKYWAYSRWKGVKGDEPNGEYGDWQKSVAKAFSAKYPNVTIEFEHLPWNGGPEKVNVAIASKTQPDILEDGTIRFFGYAARGALLPLDSYFTSAELADFDEGTWDAGLYKDGKHYLLPWANAPQHLLINKYLFVKAGAENLLPKNAEKSWTFDEFKAALKAVSKLEGVYPTAIYAGNEQGDSATNSIIWGYGSTIFNSSFDKIVFNSAEGVKGVEFMQSLLKEKLAMPGAETLKATDAIELFKQQKIAVLVPGNPGNYMTVVNEAAAGRMQGFAMEWAMYPTAPGVKPAFYANPIGYAVFKSNANKEKYAVDLAKFATNTENSKALKAVNLFPARKSVGNLYAGDAYMSWCSKIIKYARDPGLSSPAYAQMRACLFPELQAAYTGTKTAKQALDDFAVKAQAEVDKVK